MQRSVKCTAKKQDVKNIYFMSHQVQMDFPLWSKSGQNMWQ
jgi:hypothetical protein